MQIILLPVGMVLLVVSCIALRHQKVGRVRNAKAGGMLESADYRDATPSQSQLTIDALREVHRVVEFFEDIAKTSKARKKSA